MDGSLDKVGPGIEQAQYGIARCLAGELGQFGPDGPCDRHRVGAGLTPHRQHHSGTHLAIAMRQVREGGELLILLYAIDGVTTTMRLKASALVS